MRAEHSRAMRLAASATARGEASLLEHLAGHHVKLSVRATRSADLAAAELLLANLARLPITLSLDPSGLRTDAHRRLLAASRRADLAAQQSGSLDPVTLRVHIGNGGHADLHASAEHHGAHVSHSPLTVANPASGLGAVTCAALLSGEVFKAIIPMLPGRARNIDSFAWCPVTLTPEPDAAPMLSAPLHLADIAIIGLGAVGTAVARTLGLLDATGRATLVDPERFAIENVGTYSLGDHDDARGGRWKTELAARALPNVEITRFDLPVAEFIDRIDAGQARWPTTALTGLDSVNARRDAQMLWPQRLLDAATGDTMCGLHDVGPSDRACLRCLFAIPTAGPSAAQRLADATGLDPELLRYGDQLLREDHLATLDAHQRGRLAGQVGKPICGLAQAVGLTDLPSDDYRPSVPFVSQQAACLAVGRLLADRLGLPTCATFVQYDALIGPDHGTFERRNPLPGCYCQQRAPLVARLRESRARGAA